MRHLQEPILAVFLGNCLMLRKASTGSAFKYLKKKKKLYFKTGIWYNRTDYLFLD